MAGRRRAAAHPSPPPEPYIPPILPTKPDVPHPEVTRKTSKRSEKRDVLLSGVDDGPRAIAYGEQRLGGKLQFVHYRQTVDELWCVIELCAGECDGLIEVRHADGKTPVSTGSTTWSFWWYAGLAAGQVDLNLKSVLASWNEAFAGTSYVVLRLRRFSTLWGGAVPDLVWRMRTRKCLLPDTGTFVYSTNVWDQWYDFARWSEGKGLSSTRLDAASFTAARNADIAAGRKADSHLLLLDTTSPDDVIQTFRLMARAYWFWDANRYKVVADRPSASVATYDDSHVSASSLLDLDRTDIFDRPNKVTVWYTDTANNWQLKPMSLATVAVDAGLEDEIEEEYRLPHLHDAGQVKALLNYLLYSRFYDVKIRERWMASTSDRQLGDVVTRVIPSRGLTIPVRLLRRTKNPDNSFDVELFEYNDAKFAEFAVTETPKIQSTFPDPSIAPPDIEASSILWTEELYPTPNGDWLPKAVLTFTPPPSFPFLETVEVWVSINGGPQRHWFDTASSPAFTPTLWEAGTYTLTLKTKHRVTQEVSAGTSVAVPVVGVTGIVPEVVECAGVPSDRYWFMPQVRSLTRYGAPFWSSSGNFTTLDTAKLNDGNVTTTCATTPSASAWLRYDAGVGATKRFRELAYHHAGTLVATPWVAYSDDGTNWIAVVEKSAKETYDAGGGITARTIAWADDGAPHRYWLINFSAVNVFTEFHFSEYIGEFAQIREFRVYDMRGGTRKHYMSLPLGAIPSATTPLSVLPIMTKVPIAWDTGGSEASDVLVTVVNSAGTESVGVRSMLAEAIAGAGSPSDFIVQRQSELTLVNGVNAAVALPGGPGFVRVTGPTTSFSIGGLSELGGGTTAFLCNATAHPMTVLHQYSGASAANRITTPSGGSVIVQPGVVVAFTRDSVAERWRLWWDQIEWANVSGKPTAIARIQNNTGSFASIDVAGSAGGYAGIRFPDSHQDQTFMTATAGDLSGVYRQETSTWSWYWQNGSLVVGTVPWANIGSKPTTLGGYGITDAAPINSPAFTGTPTVPTPALADSSTKVATTAFVQTAVAAGGALQSISAISPAGSTGIIVSETPFKPGGVPFTSTATSSTTNVTLLSITGAGTLRFLGTGHSTAAGQVILTVLSDGRTVLNGVAYGGGIGGITQTPLAVTLIGGASMMHDGVNYFQSPVPEDGFTFKTSLTIQARVASGTGYVGWSYRLYA